MSSNTQSQGIKVNPSATFITKYAGFLSGGLGACCAVTFSNPFEVVKTRLQLQGELIKNDQIVNRQQNLPQALKLIFQHEGIKGLQRGLGAAYGYQLIMNGTRFGFYDVFKNVIISNFSVTSTAATLVSSIGAGAMSGVLAAFFGSPLFMVKTRLQAFSPHLPVGTQYKYSGVFNGLKEIHKENGVRGWFRGSVPAMVRTGVGSAVQLTSYDYIKKSLIQSGSFEEGFYVHATSSLLCGILVCSAMNPFDVVTTRMYNQPVDAITGKGKLYRSMFNCFASTLKTEGVRGFFKGFTAHYFRIGPHTVLTFIFMERIKVLLLKLQ
ncbi:mitochondrial carrier [Conidiobolus coronatus NRRL 28638]|uniref:Mitochondrial carrier n=1 Tax=Conidiobolus coronatus (strain ATCC 28846 / CBS 209.66 / NRRL 28638) TaxID=796925 RepID=A0A137NYT4_CONC2|nr:mitochondrial carrier [Conidiobolus coronatus NRRL 28638]|eukprot:KXN67831.1 mitochondrial carrier [Conidiobolus coronatus NRRL 28638]